MYWVLVPALSCYNRSKGKNSEREREDLTVRNNLCYLKDDNKEEVFEIVKK